MEEHRVTTVTSVGQKDVNPEQMAASHQGYDVFLCHAGENKAFVRQLVDRLEKDGLKKQQIFYDEISLQPGDELDSIIKVIESPSLKLFVFVVSKYCFESNKTWIRAEWEAALENNKQIFPIWLDDNNDGFKAFGNLVREFSYKLRKIIAQRVNLQEVSTSLDGLSEKICSLVFGDQQTKQRPQPPSNVGPSSARQNFIPDVLPAKMTLMLKWKSKLLEKADALFDKEIFQDEERFKKAEELFDRYYAKVEAIIGGCFIFNLRFFQPCNVDEFYHDHFRLGPGSLSAALTRLLVTDQMRAAAGGEELMVRVEVRYDDYIRMRKQLCMTGILNAISVDNLPTLLGPGTERRIRSADLESLDLAIDITEDSRFTEWVSHPGTRHLAKKARQVTALKRRLEIGQHRGEIQEDIVRSLQREVTRLNTQDEEAQKVLMTKTEEVNELQKTNKDLEAKIEAIMVAKPKIPIISPDEDDASRGEEAQKALRRKTEEVNQLQETIRGLEAKIEAMVAAETKTMVVPGGQAEAPMGAEGGAQQEKRERKISTESGAIPRKPEPLPMDRIQGELERLLTKDKADNEKIFDWIEANVSEETAKQRTFIRALMTAVARSAIFGEGTGQRCDTQAIQKRVVLLQKYLENESTRELQALFALQALMVQLDQPPNLLRMFFDTLYDEDVISEDAFYAWESNTDPAEQEGKIVALKSVFAFFTWLREAEEDETDAEGYNMSHDPLGVAVIINNIHFKDIAVRDGAEGDTDRLREVFVSLGFTVVTFTDLDHAKMVAVMKEQGKADHSNHDCFVCCIMSHGTMGKVFSSDDVGLDICELMKPVNAKKCPSLKGKPKLFFIQACQGEKYQGRESFDGDHDAKPVPFICNEADFFLGLATVPGYVAWRDTEDGAPYVKHLAKMLKDFGPTHDLSAIMAMVCDKMNEVDAEKCGWISSNQSTLRKNLIFKPK